MFSGVERLLAFRYLRARRKEGFISVIAFFSFIGIALGVATLIVVMAVMNGFRAELMERVLGINAHITVKEYYSTIGPDDIPRMQEQYEAIEGVANTAPIITGEVLATGNGNHAGVIVRGMRKADLLKKKLVSENIVMGSLDQFEGRDVILIGKRLAQKMRVGPGGSIRLISPRTNETFFGAVPRLKDYRVIGVFEVGMLEYDSGTVFVPMEAADIYFRRQGSVSGIEVNLTDMEKYLDKVTFGLEKISGKKYNVINWKEVNAHFFNSLEVERNVMFLILTLIILVAAFNIISGMVMLVTNKGREIAILRTIGATKGTIMRVFFLSGAWIGVVGTSLGFLLGLGFAKNIEAIRHWLEGLTGTELFSEEVYFLSRLPAKVETIDVISVVVMALTLSLLATLYPAWRAAKVPPAEGLRYE